MQKLPEASDRKTGWRKHKEKGTSRQKETICQCLPPDKALPTKGGSSFLFQQWPVGWQHLNLPAAGEANVAALSSEAPRWANLSLLAAVSVNSMPKYKKLRNEPIELGTKTLGLDKLPKAINTFLKL